MSDGSVSGQSYAGQRQAREAGASLPPRGRGWICRWLDLEDFTGSVTLQDFTLNEFRMELGAYVDANRRQLRDAPFGCYAVVPAKGIAAQPGVIFCLRQRQGARGTAINPLQPYFLIYIRDSGEIRYSFTHPKQILDLFRALCRQQTAPLIALCEQMDRETQQGQDMSRYSDLLKRAIHDILTRISQKNISNLFAGRGGKLMSASQKPTTLNDFELITWLVIKEDVS